LENISSVNKLSAHFTAVTTLSLDPRCFSAHTFSAPTVVLTIQSFAVSEKDGSQHSTQELCLWSLKNCCGGYSAETGSKFLQDYSTLFPK